MLLAHAGRCAAEQGPLWEMHDVLFQEEARTRENVIDIADALQLEKDVFEHCISTPETTEAIERDIATAQALGIAATPGVALGRIDKDGVVTIRRFIRGARPFEVFRREIDSMISEEM